MCILSTLETGWAREGRECKIRPSSRFLDVDTIPYVKAGTCSTEHDCELDVLLLIPFSHTILFIDSENITPCVETRSQQPWDGWSAQFYIVESWECKTTAVIILLMWIRFPSYVQRGTDFTSPKNHILWLTWSDGGDLSIFAIIKHNGFSPKEVSQYYLHFDTTWKEQFASHLEHNV